MKSLNAVPILVNGGQYVHVDLRDGLSHELLAGSPWKKAPLEPDEQDVMRGLVRPRDTAFDVGAHLGFHTVLLSELTGPAGVVHAFEPNDRILPQLSTTVSRLSNAHLHPWALADREGQATLFVPDSQDMASLVDWTENRNGSVATASCTIRALDDLIDAGELPRPDFVKCDVEGAELKVLEGARRMLDREDAPIILYEANFWSARAFGLETGAATTYLCSLGRPRYQVFHVLGDRLVPVPPLDPGCNHFNLVAVPASRRDRLRPLEDRLRN
jgi:FkbM family methyltransferase